MTESAETTVRQAFLGTLLVAVPAAAPALRDEDGVSGAKLRSDSSGAAWGTWAGNGIGTDVPPLVPGRSSGASVSIPDA
jgi:hypothetical protein